MAKISRVVERKKKRYEGKRFRYCRRRPNSPGIGESLLPVEAQKGIWVQQEPQYMTDDRYAKGAIFDFSVPRIRLRIATLPYNKKSKLRKVSKPGPKKVWVLRTTYRKD